MIRRLRLLLLPLSALYALVTGLRNLFFDRGLLKSEAFPVPIMLVGNLSVGGTGKTPHVEYLIRLLKDRYRVATLSRGYGRQSTGCLIAGRGTTAKLIGDEPMQYFSKFPQIIVCVCEDRKRGIGLLLNQSTKPNVIIMDDGFQHRRVNPGMKILLTSFTRPFCDDRVLPAGDLREPADGYKRADMIIVTRTPENITEADKEVFIKKINPTTRQQLFFSFVGYKSPKHFFSDQELSSEELSGRNLLLFTGIADASALVAHLKNLSASVKHLKFPDHHYFTEKELQTIIEKANSSVIITTEKDYHRLMAGPGRELFRDVECYFIPITIRLDREEEFNGLIHQYASGKSL